jgi:hypothetical protein
MKLISPITWVITSAQRASFLSLVPQSHTRGCRHTSVGKAETSWAPAFMVHAQRNSNCIFTRSYWWRLVFVASNLHFILELTVISKWELLRIRNALTVIVSENSSINRVACCRLKDRVRFLMGEGLSQYFPGQTDSGVDLVRCRDCFPEDKVALEQIKPLTSY